MIEKKDFYLIKRLASQRKYLNCISWAIWNSDDIGDTKMFHKNIVSILPKLKPNKVVIGFAASVPVTSNDDFGAFHKKHRGGRDRWLFEATLKSGFEGAYLTDIYKIPEELLNDLKHNSLKVKKHYEHHPLEQQKQLRNLKNELDVLKKINPRLKIIALGDFAFELIPEEYKRYAVQSCHYSKYGISKAMFIKEFCKAAKF